MSDFDSVVKILDDVKKNSAEVTKSIIDAINDASDPKLTSLMSLSVSFWHAIHLIAEDQPDFWDHLRMSMPDELNVNGKTDNDTVANNVFDSMFDEDNALIKVAAEALQSELDEPMGEDDATRIATVILKSTLRIR